MLRFIKMNFLLYCSWYFFLAVISDISRFRHRLFFLFPFYSIFCCKFLIFIFHVMCTTCIIFEDKNEQWRTKGKAKSFAFLTWFDFYVCVWWSLFYRWACGVVRDWGRTNFLSYKMQVGTLVSHTMSEVNQSIIVGQTNFLWLKGKWWIWQYEVKNTTVIK